MAKQSLKQRMKALSELLSLAVVGLAAAGVIQIRHADLLTGTELIGWAFIPLALLLGFTWLRGAGLRLTLLPRARVASHGVKIIPPLLDRVAFVQVTSRLPKLMGCILQPGLG